MLAGLFFTSHTVLACRLGSWWEMLLCGLQLLMHYFNVLFISLFIFSSHLPLVWTDVKTSSLTCQARCWGLVILRGLYWRWVSWTWRWDQVVGFTVLSYPFLNSCLSLSSALAETSPCFIIPNFCHPYSCPRQPRAALKAHSHEAWGYKWRTHCLRPDRSFFENIGVSQWQSISLHSQGKCLQISIGLSEAFLSLTKTLVT